MSDSTLHTECWYPNRSISEQPKSVYILHGLGEHSGRYQRLVKQLNSLGYIVGAHDHPGHGRSEGERGVVASEALFVDATEQAFNAFADETNTQPILFGHSLGGVVAVKSVLEKRVNASGLILSAPAFSPQISIANQYKVRLLTLIAPNFTQELPYVPGRLTHDQSEEDKGKDDALNHGFKSAGLVNWLVNAGRDAEAGASDITIPTLVLVAGADAVVHADNAKHFADNLPQGIGTTIVYSDYYHEILNETEARRMKVHEDIEHWLDVTY